MLSAISLSPLVPPGNLAHRTPWNSFKKRSPPNSLSKVHSQLLSPVILQYQPPFVSFFSACQQDLTRRIGTIDHIDRTLIKDGGSTWIFEGSLSIPREDFACDSSHSLYRHSTIARRWYNHQPPTYCSSLPCDEQGACCSKCSHQDCKLVCVDRQCWSVQVNCRQEVTHLG